MFFFINFLLTILSFSQGQVLVPELSNVHWKHIHYSDIKCPMTVSPSPTDHSSLPINVISLSLPPAHDYPGVLCTCSTYITSCTTSFFGQRQYEHTSIPALVSRTECLNLITTSQFEASPPPTHPLPSCAWMTTIKTESFQCYTISHSVKLDRYTMSFYDSDLFRYPCRSSPCNTYRSDTIWISKTELQKKCGPFDVNAGFLTNNETTTNSYIKLTNGLNINLKSSCRIRYCGVDGVKLSSGLFVQLSPPLTKIVLCPIDAEVKLATLETLIHNSVVSAELALEKSLCAVVRTNILYRKSITFEELGFFYPTSSGYYPVYRINNRKLERTYTNWTLSKVEAESVEWVNSGLKGISSGYNDYIKTNSGQILRLNPDYIVDILKGAMWSNIELEKDSKFNWSEVKHHDTLSVLYSLTTDKPIEINWIWSVVEWRSIFLITLGVIALFVAIVCCIKIKFQNSVTRQTCEAIPLSDLV